MTRVCELMGTGVLAGNNVSHSNRKTRRRFLPNLQTAHLFSEKLGQSITFKITPRTLRSVDKSGGLDMFLLSARTKNLSRKAKLLRTKLQKLSINSETAIKDKKATAPSKRKVKKAK